MQLMVNSKSANTSTSKMSTMTGQRMVRLLVVVSSVDDGPSAAALLAPEDDAVSKNDGTVVGLALVVRLLSKKGAAVRPARKNGVAVGLLAVSVRNGAAVGLIVKKGAAVVGLLLVVVVALLVGVFHDVRSVPFVPPLLLLTVFYFFWCWRFF
jgi:hypothetical protein